MDKENRSVSSVVSNCFDWFSLYRCELPKPKQKPQSQRRGRSNTARAYLVSYVAHLRFTTKQNAQATRELMLHENSYDSCEWGMLARVELAEEELFEAYLDRLAALRQCVPASES